jgi:hypothetical protein
MMRTKDASHQKTDRAKHHHMKHESTFKEILRQVKKGDPAGLQNYNKYIKSLLSIHTQSRENFNWDLFISSPEPRLPQRLSLNQDIAERECLAYEPTVLDRIFGQSKKKLCDLMKNTEQAKRYDDLIYNAALKQFKAEYQDWQKGQVIARGIKNAEPAAYQQAIEFFKPYQQITASGARLECESFDDCIITHLNLHWEDIVPDYMVSQAASGKILHSQMPDLKFNEICYHYLCSCALRIGVETFALLPLSRVLVNAYANLPDKDSGTAAKKVILSAKLSRTELMKINLKMLTAPEYLSVFSPQINFAPHAGFSATELLTR